MLCARHYTSTARIYGSEYFIFYCIKTWPPPTSLLKINPDPANAIISVSHSTVMAIAPPAEMQGRAMICVLQKLVLVKSVRLSQTNSPLKLLIEDDTRKKHPTSQASDKDRDEVLGDSFESFSGSQAELEAAADHLFTSPPRPRPLSFDPLPLTTPGRTVPPTPSTALHHKVHSSVEKSLDQKFDQKFGVFQANIYDALKSMREDFLKSQQGLADKIASSAVRTEPQTSVSASEPMDIEYGPSLPSRLQAEQGSDVRLSSSEHTQSVRPKTSTHKVSHAPISGSGSDSDHDRPSYSRPKKHSDKSKHKSRSAYLPSSSGEDQSPRRRHRSPKPQRMASDDQEHPQIDLDPSYYRDVALADIPNQYAEEVDTFRRILKLPDPRYSVPRPATAIIGIDDEVAVQELRPTGPSAMLPLNSGIRDAFDKFNNDFMAANLAEGKYPKPPPSTSKWYKVGQPCFSEKLQDLNADFAKICISPKPSGAPLGKVPLSVLKDLEQQARYNLTTLNFTTTFAKTSSSCNSTMRRCRYGLKETFKKVKSQVRKGADPEKAVKRGYDEAYDYFDLWEKTLTIQHKAITCLSKSLAHILQRELYTMATSGLLRREAEMSHLQPQLGETRRQELRNSSLWTRSLFNSQSVKEGEDFLLKKGTSKDAQGFGPYQNKPFRGSHHNKRRGSYRKRPFGGNSSQSSNYSFPSSRGKPNFRGSRGRFRPHNKGKGRGNPSSQ